MPDVETRPVPKLTSYKAKQRPSGGSRALFLPSRFAAQLEYISGLFRSALNLIWDSGTVEERNRTSGPCFMHMQGSLTDLPLNLVDLPAASTLVRHRDGIRVSHPAIDPPGALPGRSRPPSSRPRAAKVANCH